MSFKRLLCEYVAAGREEVFLFFTPYSRNEHYRRAALTLDHLAVWLWYRHGEKSVRKYITRDSIFKRVQGDIFGLLLCGIGGTFACWCIQ